MTKQHTTKQHHYIDCLRMLLILFDIM